MRQQPGLKILLIGNRAGLAEALAQTLQFDGHDVVIVPDAAGVQQTLRTALPDVIFVDVGLTGLDGKALIREMQQASRWRRPLLIALAQGTSDAEADYMAAGVDLYLAEPPAQHELRAFLRRFQLIVQDLDAFDPVI